MKLIVTGFSFPGLVFAKEEAFPCANTDLDEFQIYTLVILFSIQDRKLLRKSYNILILSLAVADILTAINLISNPAFVLGDAFPYPSNPILSDIFCRVIWSRMLLFQLLVFSAYICLGLVTERWYAVIRQFKYSNTFNKKRTFIYIFAVGLLLHLFRSAIRFFFTNWTLHLVVVWKKHRALVGIIQVFFKMIPPSFIMLVLFIHMVHKTSLSTVASAESKAKMHGKMPRMGGIASCNCWSSVSRQVKPSRRWQWQE